jgi:hypothetical protein
MKITISTSPDQKESFSVGEYDDTKTILIRWALSPHGNGGLPSFYDAKRVDESGVGKGKSPSYELRDIRNVLKTVSKKTPFTFRTLSSSYGIPLDLVVYLWFLGGGYLNDDGEFEASSKAKKRAGDKIERIIESLKPALPWTMRDQAGLLKIFKTVRNSIEETRKTLKVDLDAFDSLVGEIKDYDEHASEKFEIDSIRVQFECRTEHKVGLEMFTKLVPSRNIPFLRARFGKKEFFKVFPEVITPEAWLTSPAERDGIYFQVLAVDSTTRFTKSENTYAPAFLDVNGILEYSYKLSSKSDVGGNVKRFIAEMFDEMAVEFVSEKELMVKGGFGIKFNFNPYAFAEMVTNDPLYRKILFFNESRGSATQKRNKRFYAYFSVAKDRSPPTSLGIIINTASKKTVTAESDVRVRISHSKDLHTSEMAKSIFCRLITKYVNEYPNIVEIYSEVPGSNIHLREVKKKVKVDRRSGNRILALQAHNPGMFVKPHYGVACQHISQPYIVPEDKVDALKKMFKKKYPDINPSHKLMFFDNTWYACEPREDGEAETFLWPGLKLNKSANVPADYKEKYPQIPCCYKNNHYLGNKSLAKNNNRMAPKKVAVSSTYLVASIRVLLPGQYAYIPFLFTKILAGLEIEKVRHGNQETYPYVVTGVEGRPDTFFRCMELATRQNFEGKTFDKQEVIVKAVKKDVASSGFSSAKQELFDIFDGTFKKLLNSSDVYFAPEMWVSVAEKYYGVNIILFVNDTIDGDFLARRSSRARLHKEVNTKLPIIVLFRKKVSLATHEYQCEIMRHLKDDDAFYPFMTSGDSDPDTKSTKPTKKSPYLFSYEDPFIKKLLDFSLRSYSTYSISSERGVVPVLLS